MPTTQDLVKLKVDTIYAVPEQAGLLHYGKLKVRGRTRQFTGKSARRTGEHPLLRSTIFPL
jgi:hypothetical protein